MALIFIGFYMAKMIFFFLGETVAQKQKHIWGCFKPCLHICDITMYVCNVPA